MSFNFTRGIPTKWPTLAIAGLIVIGWILTNRLARQPNGEAHYTIFERDGKHAATVEHRYFSVELSAPRDKAQVIKVARAIYRDLAAELDKAAAPTVDRKRISILIYDQAWEREAGFLPILAINTPAGPQLPAWSDVDLKWWWREPADRPSEADLAIVHIFWGGAPPSPRDGRGALSGPGGDDPGDARDS